MYFNFDINAYTYIFKIQKNNIKKELTFNFISNVPILQPSFMVYSTFRILLQSPNQEVRDTNSHVLGGLFLLPWTFLQFLCTKHFGIICNLWTPMW